MHLYLQLTRSLAVTLIWIYCNKLVLRYARLRVSDPGQVSIPQPGIVTLFVSFNKPYYIIVKILKISAKDAKAIKFVRCHSCFYLR